MNNNAEAKTHPSPARHLANTAVIFKIVLTSRNSNSHFFFFRCLLLLAFSGMYSGKEHTVRCSRSKPLLRQFLNVPTVSAKHRWAPLPGKSAQKATEPTRSITLFMHSHDKELAPREPKCGRESSGDSAGQIGHYTEKRLRRRRRTNALKEKSCSENWNKEKRGEDLHVPLGRPCLIEYGAC